MAQTSLSAVQVAAIASVFGLLAGGAGWMIHAVVNGQTASAVLAERIRTHEEQLAHPEAQERLAKQDAILERLAALQELQEARQERLEQRVDALH